MQNSAGDEAIKLSKISALIATNEKNREPRVLCSFLLYNERIYSYGRSGVGFSPQIPRKRKARNTKSRKNPTEQMAKTWALFLIASCLMIKDKTDIRME